MTVGPRLLGTWNSCMEMMIKKKVFDGIVNYNTTIISLFFIQNYHHHYQHQLPHSHKSVEGLI